VRVGLYHYYNPMEKLVSFSIGGAPYVYSSTAMLRAQCHLWCSGKAKDNLRYAYYIQSFEEVCILIANRPSGSSES